MSAQFEICTYNCNGIGNHSKRKDVFDFLRKQKCDIYFLQETHLKAENENFIRSGWGYNIWLSGKETNRNGVAVLFNNTFEHKVFNVIKDPNGCFIIMDVEILKKRVTLVNIYGPSAGDNPDFFSNIFNMIEQIGNEHVVTAGDWNCALDRNIDVRNYSSTPTRPRTRKLLVDSMIKYEFIDIFRELYPDKRMYTWRKFNSVKQARLDYFMLSQDLLMEVDNVKNINSYRSDHTPVILSLRKEQFKRDRPFWKFNNSLLRDKEYVQKIKQCINRVKTQYAVPVYNLEKMNEVPNDQLTVSISDQLFFEVLLMEIRGDTISYACYKKKKDNETEEMLTKQLIDLESEVTEEDLTEIENLKNQLEELRKKKMEGMAIRSRARWVKDGEKASKYFCNLENRNYLDKALGVLEKEGGEIITDQKGILEEVKCFYEELYSCKEVVEVDIDRELQDVTKLSADDRDSIEGTLSYTETKIALKNMKNGKSPGPDGFTVEFFKFFYCDLGEFLVRSLNEGFQRGELSVTQKQGVITCIPKEGKAKRFIKNWRPISLLNISYKIGSTCIANRMKKVLPDIIHDSQTGFLKGRYLGENVRTLYDTLIYTEKQNIPGMFLLLDFEKAFDSVSWTFLMKTLDFFNFGNDIKTWIKTFYNNANACVSVNGQYSQWFSLGRGVRQGDACSPYLFLICAEILSLYIRKNALIKGIKVNDIENLLSQFADDTTLMLDGTEQSFREAIQVIIRFAQMSGLKINEEKTQVIWIGSRKNSQVRFLRDMNFIWDPGVFKVLGFKFSTDSDSITNLNFEGKLNTMKKLLVTWKKRNLTPLGKITIIKTLVIPKITHLLINLPDPDPTFFNELEKELFNFLWNGKKNKIKKSVVYKSLREGGLNMVDIRNFTSIMKLSWLRRLMNTSKWKENTLNMYPLLSNLDEFGSEYANVLMQRLNNPFWKDVLRHYKKLCQICTSQSCDEFLCENIHYNANILRDKNVVYVKEWCNAGIIYVKHLIKEDGTYLSYNEFKIIYPMLQRTNFLMFEGIVNAVKRFQKRLNIVLTDHVKNLENKTWWCIRKGNKSIQKVLLQSDTTPTAMIKWNLLFDNLEWEEIFKSCATFTKDVQLKWFQTRILHRIIPTENYLYKCKLVDSPLCTFCNTETQTIEHLFWRCEISKRFWDELLIYIKDKCPHCLNLQFNEILVIFGTDTKQIIDKVLVFILTTAKFYLYKCKLNNTLPHFRSFKNVLKSRCTVEKFTFVLNEHNTKTRQLWLPYTPLLESEQIL